ASEGSCGALVIASKPCPRGRGFASSRVPVGATRASGLQAAQTVSSASVVGTREIFPLRHEGISEEPVF
ncbi:unnamed protein product, partial [Gulo gulo]